MFAPEFGRISPAEHVGVGNFVVDVVGVLMDLPEAKEDLFVGDGCQGGLLGEEWGWSRSGLVGAGGDTDGCPGLAGDDQGVVLEDEPLASGARRNLHQAVFLA